MIEIEIKAQRPYKAMVGLSLADLGKEVLQITGGAEKALVVSSKTANKFYGSKATGSLKESGIQASQVVLEDGEGAKTISSLEKIYTACAKAGLGKGGVIVGLGGGTVGDAAGFVASTYMRGVSLVHVPTTLLAMVDSSIGGKTAINTRDAKNLVGSFYQPRLVACDLAVLGTLPKVELQAGLCEAIKTAAIADRDLLIDIIENTGRVFAKDEQVLERIVSRCVSIKGKIVGEDEREEKGTRHFLNFGHTTGHAIEKESGFGISHGEAVALGMKVALKLSQSRRGLKEDQAGVVATALQSAGLGNKKIKFSHAGLWNAMALDKKTRQAKPRFVLLDGIGKPILEEGITFREFSKAVTDSEIGVAEGDSEQ
ncbi:3-dehydroquinate synthase [Candidatus Parvarchaeota archaeon]|nr:3-dehydroquinate synthase [Candidatus Parvarchaeota archaeon]